MGRIRLRLCQVQFKTELALPCLQKKALSKAGFAWQSDRMAQSQISRTLREEAAVSRVTTILSRERFESRSALGRRVCEEFSFFDARGRP